MRKKMVIEIVGGEPYEYYPMGKYVVRAKGVCGGRPTFKYTRIEIRPLLAMVASTSIDAVVEDYEGRISREAILEALEITGKSDGTDGKKSLQKGGGLVIVLDEQLCNRSLRDSILSWYQGAVVAVKELRPNTIVKDDVIPPLLRKRRWPTFVTINVGHFWGKVPIDNRFCVVCFVLPGESLHRVPSLLRLLFGRRGPILPI